MAWKTTTRLQDDVVGNMFCIIGKEKQSALYINCLVKQSNNLE
jgi:hypothetical protein